MLDDTKTCPYCQSTIKKQAKKCRFCGKFLNETEEYNKTVNNSTSNAAHEIIDSYYFEFTKTQIKNNPKQKVQIEGRTYTIDIPQNKGNDIVLRLKGEGTMAPNGQKGDIYLNIILIEERKYKKIARIVFWTLLTILAVFLISLFAAIFSDASVEIPNIPEWVFGIYGIIMILSVMLGYATDSDTLFEELFGTITKNK